MPSALRLVPLPVALRLSHDALCFDKPMSADDYLALARRCLDAAAEMRAQERAAMEDRPKPAACPHCQRLEYELHRPDCPERARLEEAFRRDIREALG